MEKGSLNHRAFIPVSLRPTKDTTRILFHPVPLPAPLFCLVPAGSPARPLPAWCSPARLPAPLPAWCSPARLPTPLPAWGSPARLHRLLSDCPGTVLVSVCPRSPPTSLYQIASHLSVPDRLPPLRPRSPPTPLFQIAPTSPFQIASHLSVRAMRSGVKNDMLDINHPDSTRPRRCWFNN